MARKKSGLSRQERYKLSHPWVRLVEWARRRCNDTGSRWYPYYGARGITCDLVAADLAEIWKRDCADKLKRPSLDRIDSTGNYTKSNVRIIEFNDNSRLSHDVSFRFLYNGREDNPPLAGIEEETEAPPVDFV